jgi:hypothetical protein
MWVSDIGGTTIGSINAGTETAILRVVNGDLISTHTGSTPDITAGTVVLQSPGSTGSLGRLGRPLLLQTSNLRASITGTGDINLTNVAAGGNLNVALAQTGSTIGGAITLTVAGGNLTTTATTGTAISAVNHAVTLTASGAILSGTPSGVTDVSAPGLAVPGATGIGTAANPLKTALDDAGPNGGTFAASVGTGGVFVSNTSPAMNVGNVSGVAGVTATGGNVTIAASADLAVLQPVSTATSGPNTGAVTLSGNGNITVQSAVNGGSASVLGGAGADVITINADGSVPLTLNGQGGGDSYQVGIALLTSPVIIAATGGGTNTATVKGPVSAATLTVTSTQVSLTAAQAVNYSGIQGLVVNGGVGGDTFNVQSAASGTPVTVNGGNGDDTFNVRASANASVTVNGGSQNTADTLNYNTAGLTGINVQPTQITADGVQPVFYSGMEVVNPLFADAFNRADSPNLGSAWTQQAGQFAVSGNRAVSQAALSVATANGLFLADAAVSADVTVPAARGALVGLLTRYSGPGDSHAYLGGIFFVSGHFYAGLWRNVNGTWVGLGSRLLAGFSGSGNIRLENFGKDLELFVNNTLRLAAADAALTSGTAGMRATLGGRLDNLVVSRQQTVPAFQDNFNRPNNPTLGPNWTNPVSGLRVVSNQARGTTALSLATVAGVRLADVTVSADVTVPRVNGGLAGLVARYSGPGSNNMYLGGILFSGGVYRAVILRNLRGAWTVLGISGSLGGANVSRNVRFQVVGTTLQLFVGGTLEVGVTDAALSSGGVGLRTTANGTFDNFSF